MSVYEIISTMSLTSTVLPIICSMILEVITKKIDKNKINFDDFIECIEITQNEFAQNYNDKYDVDTRELFSHILNISADSKKGEYNFDNIIAELIRSSFDTEPTEQMIEVWKQYFSKNITNSKKYFGFKIAINSSNIDNGEINSLIEEKAEKYKNVNLFLSYSWKDEKKADEIDTFFSDLGVEIKRDKKSIEQWGSIRNFMDSIQNSDYAILIISDAYLKSVNCMYEITQLMKDVQYKDRIFPVIIDTEIYQLKKRIDYIVYWEEKYDEIKKEVARVKNPENIGKLSVELHQFREISYTIGEFLDIIKDMNNPKAEGINQAIYERLCDKKLLNRTTN